MKIRKILFLTLFISFIFTNVASADEMYSYEEEGSVVQTDEETTSFNYALKAGTLGLGLDLSTSLNDWMSLRLNANGFSYDTDDESRYNSQITTDKTYDLQTIGLLVDFHLLQLRLTAGAYVNNNQIIDIATPTTNSGLFLNGVNYTSSSITKLEQTISFNKISPYFGIGWGNNTHKKGWNISLDIGLMYHGNPTLELDMTMNSAVSEAQADEIRRNAKEEIKVQEDDLSDFPFYPVVMIGMSYSF